MFFADVNECAVKNGGCDHKCTNEAGSFNCSCKHGYLLSADGKTCKGKKVATKKSAGFMFSSIEGSSSSRK